MKIIEIKNLYKTLDHKVIYRDLNLTVNKGETLVIVGRSGCGKSVLLKHIIGIMRPDKGEVWVHGRNINKVKLKTLDSLRKKIGMVFQGAALFDSLTVAENVCFYLSEHTNISQKERYKIAEETLYKVGLKDILEKYPADLSGGMKKRVGIARAIAYNPEVILYDEPTTGLDPITADAIDSLIKNLHVKLNVTGVVVTHDIKSAYKIADRIAMIYNGNIIAEGTPEEIRNSDSPYVRQFVNGSSEGPIPVI